MQAVNRVLKTLVSIHAPAWGATYEALIQMLLATCFNPRSRMGSDQLISTHWIEQVKCFNPRSRMGSD